MCNNFEISLVVFMPSVTANHAITYTKRRDVKFPRELRISSTELQNKTQLCKGWINQWILVFHILGRVFQSPIKLTQG